MKKFVIFLLIAVMLLAVGCEKNDVTPTVPTTTAPTTEATTEPTTEPTTVATTEATEPIPECVNATVQAADAPAILLLLNRGDTVDVVKEYDEGHYMVKVGDLYGLVEKQLLRFPGDAAYDTWKGYAKSNAPLYDNYLLTGKALQNLSLNKQVEVLEDLKYCYMVKVGETIGFMPKDKVSKSYIQSSGGGGSADGGDISLGFGGIVTLSGVVQSGEVTGTAEVLADGTQVILAYFDREELVGVVAEEGFAPAWDGYYTLYMNGLYAYLPQNMALLDGEQPYEQWNGYASHSARRYDNALLRGDGKSVTVNTAVTVLWDGGSFYVVSINGEICYMAPSQIGTGKFSTGGGDSGGDWTPPAM